MINRLNCDGVVLKRSVESKTHFHLRGVNELPGLANNKIFFEALVSFDVNEVSFKRT